MTTTDAEIVETQALAVRPPEQQSVSLFGTSEPVQIIQKATAVATALKDVVKQQGLISNIKGKEYPKCEAWTLLGTMLGVFPVLVWTKQVENGWEARVEARTRDGSIVGAAEAQCLRGERNWQDRDDFALRSMAQTRATAKALRMPLGFVMTLAGYQVTPAEEMDYGGDSGRSQAKTDVTGSKNAPQVKGTRTGGNSEGAQTPAEDVANHTLFLSKLRDMLASPDAEAEFVRFLRNAVAKNGKVYLLPNESLPDVSCADLRVFVNTWPKLYAKVEQWLAENPANTVPQGTRQPTHEDPNSPTAKWRSFPVPFGRHSGVMLSKLDKKALYGFWANFEVETHYNGKPKKPETIARDQLFRDHLDAAGIHYGFTPPEDQELPMGNEGDQRDPMGEEEPLDIPF